jgi:hypothetical protein
MEKRVVVDLKKYFYIILLSFLIFVPFAYAGFLDDLLKDARDWITGKAVYNETALNITISNTAPALIWVSNASIAAQSVSESSKSPVNFSFVVMDADGYSNLNISTAKGTFQFIGSTGESNRTATCYNESGITPFNNATTMTFNCTVYVWYWDGNGAWNINASIKDNADSLAENTSTYFDLGLTTGMIMSPTSLLWPSISLTTTDSASLNNITINNTANKDLTQINVTGVNLQGESNLSQYLLAGNFSVSWQQSPCNVGDVMANNTPVTITTANITAGNLTAGQANETLWFCLEEVTSLISQQSYSTSNTSNWEVRIN